MVIYIAFAHFSDPGYESSANQPAGNAGTWMEQKKSIDSSPRRSDRNRPAPRMTALIALVILVEAIIAGVVAYRLLRGKP